MDDSVRRRTLYLLDGGYKISQVIGKEDIIGLRDKSSNLVAVIKLNGKEIVSVKPHDKASLNNKEIDLLHGVFNKEGYAFGEKVASELGLSTLSINGGEKKYLSNSELNQKMLAKIFSSKEKKLLLLGSVRRNTFIVPAGTKECTIVLNNTTKIRELTVEKSCMLNINMQGNNFIKELQIKDDFSGLVEASESSLKNINIGNSCYCDFICFQGRTYLMMNVGRYFGGKINIENSCFHHLDIGHYCDAEIVLRQNEGRRRIKIDGHFKGLLSINGVCSKTVNLGKHCKGNIFISNMYENKGVNRLSVGEDFSGKLNISNAVSRVELGKKSSGKVKFLNDSRIRIVKFDEDFTGEADMSYSSVIYVRAKKGSYGNINLSHCRNLTLLKIPEDKRVNVKVDKEPLGTVKAKGNIYCKYHYLQLPSYYFTPLHVKLRNKAQKILSIFHEEE